MSEYVIDGFFITQRITGTQRYAYEIVGELDKLVEKNKLQILVPAWTDKLPEYENIEVVRFGKHKGIAWQQIDLMRYLKKNKKQGIFLNNVFSLSYPHGIITIHDVCYKANPQFYYTFRDKISMLWHRLNYWCAARSNMKILTDSEFSKSEIIKYYCVSPERIYITHNGWQHLKRIHFADDTFERYDFLSPGNYYFSMSTLGANKNFRWLLHAAKKDPDSIFAIAGGGKLKGAAEAEGFVNLPNIHFLGYINDEDAKTLMANCKAFLFPTLYEGFGIPPLEAAACGCKRIILSDTPCMHEIYTDNAAYIDPKDYGATDFCSNIVFCKTDELLDNYSWRSSAQKILTIL